MITYRRFLSSAVLSFNQNTALLSRDFDFLRALHKGVLEPRDLGFDLLGIGDFGHKKFAFFAGGLNADVAIVEQGGPKAIGAHGHILNDIQPQN